MGSVCGKKDDAKPEKIDVEEPTTATAQKAPQPSVKCEETTTKDPGYKLKTIEQLWLNIAHYSDATEIPTEDEQLFNISELVAFLKMAQDVEGSLEDEDVKAILERVCVHLRDEMRDGKSVNYREFWLIMMKILRTRYIKPIVESIAAAVEKDRDETLGFKTTKTFVVVDFDEFFLIQELWNNLSRYSGDEKQDLSKQTFSVSELVAFIKIAGDIKIDLTPDANSFLEKLCDGIKINMKDCEAMNYVEFRMIVLSLLQKLHIKPLLEAICEAIEKDKKAALELKIEFEGMDELSMKPRRDSSMKLVSIIKLWSTISGYNMTDETVDITTQTLSMAELVAFLKMVEDIMSSLTELQQQTVQMIRAELRDEMKNKVPMKWDTFRTIILRLLKHHFIKPVTDAISVAIDDDREKLLGFTAHTEFAPDQLDDFAEVQELWNVVAGYRGDDGKSPVGKQTFTLSELVAFLKISRDIEGALEDAKARVLLGWLCECIRYEMMTNPVICYSEFRAVVLSLLQDLYIEPLIQGIDHAVKKDQEATLNFVNDFEVVNPPLPPPPQPIAEEEDEPIAEEEKGAIVEEEQGPIADEGKTEPVEDDTLPDAEPEVKVEGETE